ncbi:MAG: hypothetical protein ACYSR9_07630 [Planctomycetota bacterium]|jgi:hypothetical protein
MIAKNINLFVLTAACVILTACTALKLRDANHELADLYLAKNEAIAKNLWQGEVTANAALEFLARDAAEQAAKEDDPENKISFYRIAATAAWQASSTAVIEYAVRGSELCDKGHYERAPRDCGMLLIIPYMASVDELTNKYNDIQQRFNQGENPGVEEVTRLFNDLQKRLNHILKSRSAIAASSAHPKLLEEIDRRSGQILCKHIGGARAFIVRVAGTESQAFKGAMCDTFNIEVKLMELGFTNQTAACLPPDKPVKPEGCP